MRKIISGPLTFLTLIDLRNSCTLSCIIKGRDIGHLIEVVGVITEMSVMEVDLKRRLKSLTFLEGALTTDPSEGISEFAEVVGDII